MPAVFVLVIAIFAAVLWPPTYQSTATILIEEPDVPRDLVRSTVTSYAAERLQVITQRIMTSDNLINIIKKFNLFQKEREIQPINAVASAMRENLEFQLLSADVIDPRSGRSTEAAIAFTLSFEYRSASVAQLVVNELVSLYLKENLRVLLEKVTETTDFLREEAGRYGELVAEYEQKLSEFKTLYAGNLPAQQGINLQLMDRTERELSTVRRRLQELAERRIFLQAQLSQVNPYEATIVDGHKIVSPEAQLRDLETRLITLQGVYGPDHPDVRKALREIKALRKETGVAPNVAELHARQNAILSELSVARERYSDNHPDVLKLQRQLTSVESAIKDAGNYKPAAPVKVVAANNPTYIQIQTQLETLRLQEKSYGAEYAMLQIKMNEFEDRAVAAPEIEREYTLIRRDYEAVLKNFQDVRGKLIQAELGAQLEKKRKGEHFTLIEPPNLPSKPIKPNRLAIVLLGIVLAIGMGGALVFMVEMLDQAVYGPRQLAVITGVSPLVVIPYITNQNDNRRVWGRRMALGAGVTVSVMVALYWFQDHGPPLDVLHSIVERKFEGLLAKF